MDGFGFDEGFVIGTPETVELFGSGKYFKINASDCLVSTGIEVPHGTVLSVRNAAFIGVAFTRLG